MDAVLKLWCLLQNEDELFSIDINGKSVIDELKDAIYNKCFVPFKGVYVLVLPLFRSGRVNQKFVLTRT